MFNLNDINEVSAQYSLDPAEKRAYYIACLWVSISRKYFPDYLHGKIKQGNPKKCLLFKVAFKLQRETQGILEEDDYRLYVRAQCEILKHINSNKGKALIDPNCLVGDKAWVRWKLWKKKYDNAVAKPTEISQPIGPAIIKAIEGLEKTKEFITKSMGPAPSFEKYQEAYINNNIFRWVNFGKISPYYLAISPHIAALLKPEDFKRLSFDINLYTPCMTEEVLSKFKEMFPHEY